MTEGHGVAPNSPIALAKPDAPLRPRARHGRASRVTVNGGKHCPGATQRARGACAKAAGRCFDRQGRIGRTSQRKRHSTAAHASGSNRSSGTRTHAGDGRRSPRSDQTPPGEESAAGRITGDDTRQHQAADGPGRISSTGLRPPKSRRAKKKGPWTGAIPNGVRHQPWAMFGATRRTAGCRPCRSARSRTTLRVVGAKPGNWKTVFLEDVFSRPKKKKRGKKQEARGQFAVFRPFAVSRRSDGIR